ncbi:MAG: MFS transporter [Deltaproteobacteria bacterium]|nr:MFS transporter [Deltaproteobacteria bacterium]
MPEQSPIARLIGARSLNTFGRAVISATVLYELYERTHDAYVIGAVGLVQVVPVILLFVWSGSLADRVDRRTLTTLAATITGLIGLGLASCSFFGLPVWMYLALLLVQGCVTSVHAPASSSLIPLIIQRGELERVNRIGASLQELAAITGPALAGLALTWVAPSYVYAAVALTGLASGALYRALPNPRVAQATAVAGASARKDWRVGLRFIFRSPLLLPALTLDMFAVLFAGVTALLPAVASDVLHVGPFGYGVLRAAQSAGAVLMAVGGGRIPPWKRPGRVLLIVVALFGLATMGFGLSTSFPLSVVLLVLCGALDNISVVIRLTLEQMVVPDAIRGRVSAVHYVFIGMSNELGAAESGAAAGLVGTVPAIVGGGAIAVIVVLVVAAKWRELAAMPPLSQLRPPES